MVGWLNGRMVKWSDGAWWNGRMVKWLDGGMVGWLDGWMQIDYSTIDGNVEFVHLVQLYSDTTSVKYNKENEIFSN